MDPRITRNARLLVDEASQMLRADAAPHLSVISALHSLIDNPHCGTGGSTATPELRASHRVSERMGRPPEPGCMFFDVAQRDATVAGGGGYLVGTTNPGDTFASALRAYSVGAALGVRELPMESANAAIPKIASDITTYWLASESTQVTEGNHTFGLISGAPKTVGAYFEISDRLLKQITPAGERFLLTEIGKAVAAAVDVALIQGSGASGQPLGIVGTSGIGSNSGASVDWSDICKTIADVEDANAFVSPASAGWAIASDAAEILRQRDTATAAGRFILSRGEIDGQRAAVSNSVPSGTAVYGDWSNVALVSWGALELGVMRADASSTLFKAGIVGVRCLWSVDVMVLQAASFSKLTSIS